MERFIVNDHCLVTEGGQELRLSVSEAVVLGCLIRANRHLVPNQLIARALWGDARDWAEGWAITLNTTIFHLRQRLKRVDAGRIVNQHGQGYYYDHAVEIDYWPEKQ